MQYLILALLFLVGCTSDNTVDNILGDNSHILTLSIRSTRTSLGDKVGENYPVYWNEGDKIVVNGLASTEAEIDATNPALARFIFSNALHYPYLVTYPYTSNSTATVPKVVFPVEQVYREGSFCKEGAPMCGYAADKSSKVELKHLAGVLRLPVKAENEGEVLQKIVISSSSAKLSGEFSVECQSGNITPTESTSNSVTYILPLDFTLSAQTESVFYISLPQGDTGACQVEFVGSSAKSMIYTWSNKSIKSGIVREFKTITYKPGTTGNLDPFEVDDDKPTLSASVFGYVKDTNGNPIANVAVSDGFSVVSTDANGFYSIDNISSDCWHIYITVPAAYKLDTDERNVPCFYQKYIQGKFNYNFELTPIEGGVEQKFALFSVTDIHLGSLYLNSQYRGTFENKVVPHINSEYDKLTTQGIPCYGINLGDYITNMGSSCNDSAHHRDILVGYRASKVPFFTVMGNHDHNYFSSSKPLTLDERNSTYNLKAQRIHEEMLGPANFSFDRGNIHIVAMRNTLFPNNTSYSKLVHGYTDEQVEWLRQDLALVPKDKTIMLCIHEPMFNYDNGREGYQNIAEVRQLLNEFDKIFILSGHTHYQRNIKHKTFSGTYKSSKIVEFNTAPVSGSAWKSPIAGDGTPAGYKIYTIEGGNLVDDRYISYNKGERSSTYQMRLYWGNAKMGAPTTAEPGSADNPHGTKGFYAFNIVDTNGKKVLMANLFNVTSDWVIKVYENDVHKGNMKIAHYANPKFADLVGDGSISTPWRAADGVETAHDFYATGYILGLQGLKSDTSGAWTTCFHMYKYTLTDNDANIRVEATDQYGNTFTETVIIGDTDFSQVAI